MRRTFGVSIAFTLLLALPAAVRAQSSGEGAVSLPIGTQAPAATVDDLDGNAVQLLDYVQGKPALIEFWATWCELCAALQPQLDHIQQSYHDRMNIVAVAVAVAQTPRRVKRRVEDDAHGYPYVYDAKGAAVRAFAATTTSVVVMLDADGKVVYTGVGSDQDLTGAVERLLGS